MSTTWTNLLRVAILGLLIPVAPSIPAQITQPDATAAPAKPAPTPRHRRFFRYRHVSRQQAPPQPATSAPAMTPPEQATPIAQQKAADARLLQKQQAGQQREITMQDQVLQQKQQADEQVQSEPRIQDLPTVNPSAPQPGTNTPSPNTPRIQDAPGPTPTNPTPPPPQ